MKAIASPELSVAVPPRLVVVAGHPRLALRKRLARHAAHFWLSALFWNARRNPHFTRAVKWLFVEAAWTFSPFLRENTLCNARRILGKSAAASDRESLARAVIGNFYDFVCDVGRCAGMTRRQLVARIDRVHGDEVYRAARAEHKGAIVVTAHMGSFEIGIAPLLDRERRVHVLFRRDASGLFERTRAALRKRLGVIEACVDDGLAVWLRLREALADDDVVLIQGDRVMPGQKGCRVPFLDGHVLLPAGPVKLALATGAPIIPIFSVRQGDGRTRLFVETPIHVSDEGKSAAATLKLAGVIADYVRRFPDQWLMVHRAWCEDSPGACES